MNLPNIDPKDVKSVSEAFSGVIQSSIGETQSVIVKPLADQLTGAMGGLAAQVVLAAQEIKGALSDLPGIAGDAAGKVLDQMEGLTVTTTITMVVSRKK